MPDTDRTEALLVDDDALVREALGSALRRSGFVVRVTSGGQEAVEAYRQHGARIGVVLLAVKMPGLDGPQTLAALRALDPDVRCCFISGDTEDETVANLLTLGASRFFPKPFRLAEVTDALRHLLGGQP
jgi:DNA-binding response OmpR family regulator